MSDMTFLLGRLGLLAAIFAFGAAGCALFLDSGSAGRRWFGSRLSKFEGELSFLRSRWRARHFVGAQILVLGLVSLAVSLGGSVLLLVLVPTIVIVPLLWVRRRVVRRIARIEEQIEGWLVALANALHASPSLGEALESTVPLVPAPLREDLDLVVKEYELGTPLDVALERWGARVDSRTLGATLLALRVARRTGGNLPEMLESAAGALRELARLEGVVRTKTAEGKSQALVIGAVPLPLVLGLHALDPHFFEPLTQSFAGNLLAALAALLWGMALVLARKILAVDV